MNQSRDKWIVGLALFSMFFGAGNVVFPPFLGLTTASLWFPAFVSYYLADIGLALLAIFAMLKCNSDIEGVTRRIGKIPAIFISTVIVLCVGPLLAIPRTAASTFEMPILPLFPGVNSVVFSVLFFVLILALCLNESSVVDIVGKFLTPALFTGLMVVIFKGIINPIGDTIQNAGATNVVADGVASGYQTMDVLAALIFGVIIVKTVTEKGYTTQKQKYKVIGGAGLIAAAGLMVVYGGLTYLGATASSAYTSPVTRANLVTGIIRLLMGNLGIVIFAVVVALACITTAVALVSSSGTYFSRLTKGKISYKKIVVAICISSAAIANVGLDAIISFSAPILSIVYAPALTLIILTLVGDSIKNDNVFKMAAFGSLLVSLMELAASKGFGFQFVAYLPLSRYGFAWVVPTIIFGCIGYFIKSNRVINTDHQEKDDSDKPEVKEGVIGA